MFEWNKGGNTELLQRYVMQGLSFRVIAERLGCSRNAAIGKAKRLDCASPTKKKKRAPLPLTKQKPSFPDPVQEPEPLLIDGIPLDCETIGHGQCRWPLGDPSTRDFYFCGHATQSDSPYCKHHTVRAWNPEETQKSNRRHSIKKTKRYFHFEREKAA